MTKLQIETKKAIKLWCKKNKLQVKSIRHIYPRAYLLAKLASACILVSTPYQDAEKHMRDKEYSSYNTINYFESTLQVGDWCGVAYICMDGIQTNVAIPAVMI